MEEFAQIVDSIVWPLAAVIIVLAFLLLFRGQIAALIRNIRSITREGIQASESAREEATAKANTARQEFMENPQSVVLQEQEQRIKKELEGKGLDSTGDVIDILVREYARIQMNYHFLDTYGLIYGTELRLLQHLNEVTGTGITENGLKTYVDTVKAQYLSRSGTGSVEEFTALLLAQNLLLKNNDRYFITNLGREFLAWIVRDGRSQNLPQ